MSTPISQFILPPLSPGKRKSVIYIHSYFWFVKQFSSLPIF